MYQIVENAKEENKIKEEAMEDQGATAVMAVRKFSLRRMPLE